MPTSTERKDKWNKKTYIEKKVRIRKDSGLAKALENNKESFNGLVVELLEKHFRV